MKMTRKAVVLLQVVLILVSCVYCQPASPAPGTVITVTSATALDECVNNTKSKLVILKVETPGCAGCVYIEPDYKLLAQKYANQIVCLSADYMQVPECCWRYHIKQIPTFVFYRNGKILEFVTTTIKSELEDHIIKALKA